MSRGIHETVSVVRKVARRAGRSKSKGDRLRQALARRRLEEYREQQVLQQQIADIFSQ